MAKRMVLTILALTLVFGGVFGWKAMGNYFMGQYFANFQPPPEAVATAPVQDKAWQPTLEAIGSIRAVAGIDVSTEVAGIVERITFDSGAHVEKGELLLQLDDKADRAELEGLLAEEKLATLNLTREQSLARRQLGSEADRDTARTQLEQARARVAYQRERIAQKRIRAPFSGRLGIRRVDPGQYVAAGTPLVSLVSLDPIYAEFTLPEQELPHLHVDLPVRVTVGAETDRPVMGRISATEARVDEKTRTVRVQATLENPDERLRPGMFANVAVLLPDQPTYATVPRTALTYSLYGDFVYVVEREQAADKDPQLKAVQRFVTAGPSRGNEIAILQGVTPGEEVVAAGQFKLHNGAAIRIENGVTLN